jgi:hypothetical protein
MYEELRAAAAAVTSVKAAADLAKAFVDVKGAVNVQGKVFELQRVILAAQQDALAAQEAQAALLDRIRDLEKRISDSEAWEREKQRCELAEIGPGVFAYCLKADAQGSEPFHRICQRCSAKGQKFVLQHVGDHLGSEMLACQECGAKLTVHTAETERLKADRQREWNRRPPDWKTL